jgi:hypothetical protein
MPSTPAVLPARRGGARMKENKLLSRHISQNMNTSLNKLIACMKGLGFSDANF